MITLPSWENSSPAPMPKMESAIAEAGLVQLDVDRAEQDDRRQQEREQSGLGDALGSYSRASLGPTIAATNMVTDIGNRRLPVSKASKPSTTCR